MAGRAANVAGEATNVLHDGRPDSRERAPLRVHVLIDQEIADASKSGLVRCWTKFLPELARHPDLDVVLHAVGDRFRSHAIGPRTRIVEHAPGVVSTEWLPRIGLDTPVRTGLLPFHRGLARALRDADLIHTTDTLLPFACTGAFVASRRKIPLVTSLHTQVPLHAEIHARAFARRVFGGTPLRGPLVERDGFARAVRRFAERQQAWFLRRCARVFVSEPADIAPLPVGADPARTAVLGRGLDPDALSPALRDPGWLRVRFGIPASRAVVLSVGRLMAEKSPERVAEAVATLVARGRDVALLCCGEGGARDAIARRLGERAIFAGVLGRDELAKVYASSDVFAFASGTEMFANVVMEAMSCGLPPVVSAHGGARQHIEQPGDDGIVLADDDPAVWADAIDTILCHPGRRRRIAEAARYTTLRRARRWSDVVDEVLVPGWRAAAGWPVMAPPKDEVPGDATEWKPDDGPGTLPLRPVTLRGASATSGGEAPALTKFRSRSNGSTALRHAASDDVSGVAEHEARHGFGKAFRVVDHHGMTRARNDGE